MSAEARADLTPKQRLHFAYEAGRIRAEWDALATRKRRTGKLSQADQRTYYRLREEAQELEARIGLEVEWPQ